MEVITIETPAFQEIIRRLAEIDKYLQDHRESKDGSPEQIYKLNDEEWVDSYDVCTYLKICDKTLQRLRTSGKISYSKLYGRQYYYQIGEVRRMLKMHLIHSKEEYMNDLINSQICYAKQRRDNKPKR